MALRNQRLCVANVGLDFPHLPNFFSESIFLLIHKVETLITVNCSHLKVGASCFTETTCVKVNLNVEERFSTSFDFGSSYRIMIYYFINHLAIHPMPKGRGLLAKRIKMAEGIGFEPMGRFHTPT